MYRRRTDPHLKLTSLRGTLPGVMFACTDAEHTAGLANRAKAPVSPTRLAGKQSR